MSKDSFNQAMTFIGEGRLEEARVAFEEAVLDNPKNPDALYNLGMCFTELGQPDKAINALNRCLEFSPEFSNCRVALGYAYMKAGDTSGAERHFLEALRIEPDNPFALRNLGGLVAKRGNIRESIQYLEKAHRINPMDPKIIYGLAHGYQQTGEISKADELYRKLVSDDMPSDLRELARNGLREIAAKELKAKGFRIDAVMYMLSALRMFSKETFDGVREISFEIAFLGRSGFDINNPDKKYQLRKLSGDFSGLQLVSYMYVGFKQIAPEQDIGVDLSQEYQAALQLFEGKET